MQTLVNDLLVMLGMTDNSSLITLSVVIVAFVSLLFMFKKLL